jgi:hypothetical protein
MGWADLLRLTPELVGLRRFPGAASSQGLTVSSVCHIGQPFGLTPIAFDLSKGHPFSRIQGGLTGPDQFQRVA